MEGTLFLVIGSLLIFLGGKDPLSTWLMHRKEGKPLKESMMLLTPMFILPWPRTVNKRLIWIAAGSFLVVSGLLKLL